jgi:GR25 family glycosyltransferase involved in LPS biosynthesis
MRIAYINLDSRHDKDIHMQMQLSRIGRWAVRIQGIPSRDFCGNSNDYKAMTDNTDKHEKGAIGAYLAHRSALEWASHFPQENAIMILEDDAIFSLDFEDRLAQFSQFLEGTSWDIFFLGATYHNEGYWHVAGHENMPQCKCTLNKDWEPTLNPQVRRAYGVWSQFAYLVNPRRITNLLAMMEKWQAVMPSIDRMWILLQPQLQCFVAHPGCVRCLETDSDVGKGIRYFQFYLGSHIYAEHL